VAELKAQLKARGLSAGRLRKAELAAKLARAIEEERHLFAAAEASDDDEAGEISREEDTDTATSSSAASSSPRGFLADSGTMRMIAVAGASAFLLYRFLASMPRVEECDGVSPAWLVRTGLQGKLAPVGIAPSQDTLEKGLRRLKACSDATPQNQVILAYAALYMFFQAFLVPGPNLLLSVFAGALFPNFVFGTCMVAFSCTAGAVISYTLAQFFMGPVMERTVPDRVAAFRGRISANRDNIFFYMLFLRLTPLLPNWFINLTSPVVGVPVTSFALATLLGQMPMNILYWNCGKTFFEAVDEGSLQLVGRDMVGAVALLGVAALLPVLLKGKIEAMEKSMGKSK
jgi:uncharacterized membrane protein YdjX (TVP38/TMEM64 family)